jgi:hypothetical protein
MAPLMRASLSLNPTDQFNQPASEDSCVQRQRRRETLAVEQLEFHLFVPRRAHDPLLEEAYEVWRDVWQDTFDELDGTRCIYSDEFTRQDEIAVISLAGRCIAVAGLRWLDMSLPRSREDSYFKPWPAASVEALGNGVVGVTGNAVVHPHWRGTLVRPPLTPSHPGGPHPEEPARLAYVSIALTIQRFFASPADCSVALTRNDRGMDRVASALGAASLSQIRMHGVGTNVVRFARNCVRQWDPAVADLWRRRHQG